MQDIMPLHSKLDRFLGEVQLTIPFILGRKYEIKVQDELGRLGFEQIKFRNTPFDEFRLLSVKLREGRELVPDDINVILNVCKACSPIQAEV